MTDFLIRLGSSIDSSGFAIPSVMSSTLAIAINEQATNFLNLSLQAITGYHEHQSIAMDDELQDYLISWRRFQIETTDADFLASDSSSRTSSSSELSPSDCQRSPRSKVREGKPSVPGTSESSKSPVKERLKKTGSALLFFRNRRGSSSGALPIGKVVPELSSRRRSSTTALPASPRAESARIALRLNINRAQHLLQSIQSSVENAGEIILILGQIAGLLQDGSISKVEEKRDNSAETLMTFARTVAEFVDSLNRRYLNEILISRLTAFLDQFELNYLSDSVR